MVKKRGLSIFEKYLTLWVFLCIVVGIVLGNIAPTILKLLGIEQPGTMTQKPLI